MHADSSMQQAQALPAAGAHLSSSSTAAVCTPCCVVLAPPWGNESLCLTASGLLPVSLHAMVNTTEHQNLNNEDIAKYDGGDWGVDHAAQPNLPLTVLNQSSVTGRRLQSQACGQVPITLCGCELC